jgi:hypothetical protein
MAMVKEKVKDLRRRQWRWMSTAILSKTPVRATTALRTASQGARVLKRKHPGTASYR